MGPTRGATDVSWRGGQGDRTSWDPHAIFFNVSGRPTYSITDTKKHVKSRGVGWGGGRVGLNMLNMR
jgi:hypothetical protein